MNKYAEDRKFTDLIHRKVAVPKIYDPLGWKEVVRKSDEANRADLSDGIDYVFNANGGIVTVQERFRDKKYQSYSDFTIRYRRDGNIHTERHKSEYYKIKADYFTYGITNCIKEEFANCTDFIKYAIVDMRKVYSKIESGDIVIKDSRRSRCIIQSKKIICPIQYNSDKSSSFFPIEIFYLIKLWDSSIVVAQKGFI